MSSLDDNHKRLEDTLKFIGKDVLEPTFLCTGVVLNALVFCIWMFGPKSRSLCCATYFTANATADFLLLMIVPIMLGRGIILIHWRITDFTCKLNRSLYNIILQVSTWLSATITVERALTIILPFVFKSQDMSRRPKYMVALIIIIQPFTQIFTLMYRKVQNDPVTNDTYCFYNSVDEWQIVEILHMCLAIVIPFAVIVTFNLATIMALCRNRFRQHTVSGNQDHVHVFTKITIMTGVSFVISYFIEIYIRICQILATHVKRDCHPWMSSLVFAMVYFNSCMNPIICLVVCRSMHDDMRSFLMAVIRRVRRLCASRCWPQESETANAFPMATMV